MKKEVAGQPVWLWAVGGGVILLAYLYFKHQQGAASSAPQAGKGGGGQYKSTSSIREVITETQHAHPKPHHMKWRRHPVRR